MVIVKVKRSAYTKLRQDALAKYAQKILSKTFENPIYSDISAQVDDLKEKATAYDVALVAAAEGGTGLVFTKNQAKQAVIVSLDLLANMGEVFCKGEEAYVIGMGFEVRKKAVRTKLPVEQPEPPVNIIVKSTGNVGELKFSFSLPNKEQVVNVAIEERIANVEAPYTNGKYMDKNEMLFTGFPQLKMMEFRFRSIGKNGLKSDWTAPVLAPVL